MADEEVRPEPAIILGQQDVNLNWMTGELPGSEPMDDPAVGELFGSNTIAPPVPPSRAVGAVLSNGELAAVLHAKANGAAGISYVILPRKTVAQGGPDLEKPDTWTAELRDEHHALQAFVQAGFRGKGVQSLRTGFYEQEHDRAVLGWGGVVVLRDPTQGIVVDGMPPSPVGLGRFQARSARFTRPDPRPTPTPVPIAAEDGTILWIEEWRHFRRLVVQTAKSGMIPTPGGQLWYKEYGDWRTMDARTGKRSKNYKRAPPSGPFKPGKYSGGPLPEKGGSAALEVMTWATSFPGADPYGISGWHSELLSVDSAREAAQLLLSHLRSGLHSVILAAANRKFDTELADAAVSKIDELGRGRKGLGSLILLSLVPGESSPQSAPSKLFDSDTADRGRLILHELSTKLPPEVMDGSLRQASGEAFARAERIPDLLLGKSGAYNFATAAAAWRVVNRLVFSPHHEERQAFLDRILIEMGITNWRIAVISPEWDDPPPAVGIATVASQSAGLSPNLSLRILSDITDVPFKPFESWWGDIPFPILRAVIESEDPAGYLELLGYKAEAQLARTVGLKGIASDVISGLDRATADAAAAARAREEQGDSSPG
jgi:capsid portal protein